MFEWVENSYLNKLKMETAERLELEKARKQNQELKARHQKLEDENKDLQEKFNNNQIEILTKKNDLNSMLEELQRERKSTLEQTQRLQICKEQIDSIDKFIHDLKPIKEQLSFKTSVTECLHDLLLKTKLRIAESDEILQELHDHLKELEYDVDETRDIHERRVSQWQEEFLIARIREADVILEFDKLKRQLAFIKQELEERKLIREALEAALMSENKTKPSTSNKNNKIIERILQDEQISISNTVELQDEIDHLRIQVKQLEDQKEYCEKRLRQNEETKLQLHAVRRSMWIREYETNQKISLLKQEYEDLGRKMNEELERIQKNIEDKDSTVGSIVEKIKEVENVNVSLQHKNESDSMQDPVLELESKKIFLENEISKLTPAVFHRITY